MKYAVTTAPTAEPLHLVEAKQHLRTVTGDTSEDGLLISPLITAARDYCENVTGLALAPQTIQAYPTGWGLWRLPRPPIISVTSIKYYDEDNTVSTMAATDYQLDTVDGLVLILEEPSTVLRELNPIVIEYKAGYTTLPMLIRQAMLLLVAHWYQNREAINVDLAKSIRVDANAQEISYSVRRLLSQYKVWWHDG
jgi:uncharacterized phiE125 gp8 family phage protein